MSTQLAQVYPYKLWSSVTRLTIAASHPATKQQATDLLPPKWHKEKKRGGGLHAAHNYQSLPSNLEETTQDWKKNIPSCSLINLKCY